MLLDAVRERRDQEEEAAWNRTAWLGALVVSFFSSTPISPHELLHPPDPAAQRDAFNAATGLTDPVDIALAKQRARE